VFFLLGLDAVKSHICCIPLKDIVEIEREWIIKSYVKENIGLRLALLPVNEN